jgi:hypothetical protein
MRETRASRAQGECGAVETDGWMDGWMDRLRVGGSRAEDQRPGGLDAEVDEHEHDHEYGHG